MKKRKPALTSLQFFSRLRWVDGRDLLSTMEPYRRELFTKALDTYRKDGSPQYNWVTIGRAKKNNKTTDLDLGVLYCVVVRRSGDGLILANDEEQAADDLKLLRLIIEANPELQREFHFRQKELKLRDGSATIKILPAKDIAGSHGKVFGVVGFDEIHDYRNWDLFEALTMDPTKPDALTWVTSYDTIYNTPGVPLYDLKLKGQTGEDDTMLFSWHSGDLCTDPEFAELPPEERANPSLPSWPSGLQYLQQQKRRLPSNKYRRLHLNLPGSPSGAFLDQATLLAAIVSGRKSLPYEPNIKYRAFVDMSGGSSDDAVLCIVHLAGDGRTVIVDLVEKQPGGTPFNPRDAVARFCVLLERYHIASVTGDNYAGETFKADFAGHRRGYVVSRLNKSELYEAFEVTLNAGEVELLDHMKTTEQALTLVVKGSKIDAEKNGHDDYINAVAGAAWCATQAPADVYTSATYQQIMSAPKRPDAARVLGLGERQLLQMQRSRMQRF